jgi:hypothetical protein
MIRWILAPLLVLSSVVFSSAAMKFSMIHGQIKVDGILIIV